jgi:hypothetical protein
MLDGVPIPQPRPCQRTAGRPGCVIQNRLKTVSVEFELQRMVGFKEGCDMQQFPQVAYSSVSLLQGAPDAMNLLAVWQDR